MDRVCSFFTQTPSLQGGLLRHLWTPRPPSQAPPQLQQRAGAVRDQACSPSWLRLQPQAWGLLGREFHAGLASGKEATQTVGGHLLGLADFQPFGEGTACRVNQAKLSKPRINGGGEFSALSKSSMTKSPLFYAKQINPSFLEAFRESDYLHERRINKQRMKGKIPVG